MSEPARRRPGPIAIGSDDLGYSLKVALVSTSGRRGSRSWTSVATSPPRRTTRTSRSTSRVPWPPARSTVPILVCGTGIGMAITANKIPGVRAASVADPYSAERARKSNDAQVLCLGARVVGAELAKLLLDHWLASEFGGGSSARKVAKIDALDHDPSDGKPANA